MRFLKKHTQILLLSCWPLVYMSFFFFFFFFEFCLISDVVPYKFHSPGKIFFYLEIFFFLRLGAIVTLFAFVHQAPT